MKSRGEILISKEIFIDNLNYYKKLIEQKEIIAVIKANAYGLGVDNIISLLKLVNVNYVALVELDIAIKLKKSGFKVLLLGTPLISELEIIIDNEIQFCISNMETVEYLEKNNFSKKPKVCLEFDTGMGRLGFLNTVDIPDTIEIIGIMSHLSSASCDVEYTKEQIRKFKKILSYYNLNRLEVHIANSDGTDLYPELYQNPFTHIRIGIGMYGLSSNLNTDNCISLKSHIISKRILLKGSGIGYDKTFILEKDTLVGTIPLGYADGIPFQLANKSMVLINNKLCPIIGKISMDYFTIDLSDCISSKIGDSVELIWNRECISNWAILKNTHNYDILCSFGTRIVRRIV